MTGIPIYIFILSIGFMGGFLLKVLLSRRTNYSGILVITKHEEKTIYSLELDENPDDFEFKKKVVFKVQTSEENLIRD